MAEKAKLIIDGSTYELPVIVGSEGEKAIDISNLRTMTKAITMDQGYGNTGACFSDITFLDGEVGILKYRGIPIEELAAKASFLEIAYLIIYGNLPTAQQLENWEANIRKTRQLPDGLVEMINRFPEDTHPMAVPSACTVALSAYYPEYAKEDLSDEEMMEVFGILISAVKNIAASQFRLSRGLPLVDSNPQLSYSADFLGMLTGKNKQSIDEDVVRALDVLLILHADHEQNCSTSAVRLIGSSRVNIFASITGGIAALWGSSHGGANQAVVEMLSKIYSSGNDYKKFLTQVKDKTHASRLMGFGHRVYKNFDPRAKLIKKSCDEVLNKLGVNDPLLALAKNMEREALADPYFVERKLYPNVDFYSGIIYKALGIPTNMFTVMFAIGRFPGWLAQWREMRKDSKMKICRPRQIYTGEVLRPYVDIKDRK